LVEENLLPVDGVALLFGSKGAIGSTIAATFERQGWGVVTVSHVPDSGSEYSVEEEGWASRLGESGYLFNSVIWAQGTNLNDSVVDFDSAAHEHVVRANLKFVIDTMSRIMNSSILAPSARFTVLSSIWATLARSQKMSYMISKAGLQALVRSAAIDLAPRGISVNSVSPGIIDSSMTRSFVSEESLERIAEFSNGGKLATLQEVANVVCWLSGPNASGLSGQDLIVDRGWGTFKSVEP
jgi:3-oxoacyl-[acyl-carrier protein] reductase